jgi:hypothetical protein
MLAQPLHGQCHFSDVLIIEDFSDGVEKESRPVADFVLPPSLQATCAAPEGLAVPLPCRPFRFGW